MKPARRVEGGGGALAAQRRDLFAPDLGVAAERTGVRVGAAARRVGVHAAAAVRGEEGVLGRGLPGNGRGGGRGARVVTDQPVPGGAGYPGRGGRRTGDHEHRGTEGEYQGKRSGGSASGLRGHRTPRSGAGVAPPTDARARPLRCPWKRWVFHGRFTQTQCHRTVPRPGTQRRPPVRRSSISRLIAAAVVLARSEPALRSAWAYTKRCSGFTQSGHGESVVISLPSSHPGSAQSPGLSSCSAISRGCRRRPSSSFS